MTGNHNDRHHHGDERHHAMREAMIILPTTGNDGSDLGEHIDHAKRMATRAFGGCTLSGPDWGCWADDDGNVQEERVIKLTAACEPNEQNNQTLNIIARSFAMQAKQKAMYVRLPDGHVDIIDTENLWNKKHPRYAELSEPKLAA